MNLIESFQVQMNSKNADVRLNGDNSNCLYYLPKFDTNSQQHLYISLISASIPYTFYNINILNNLLSYTINGVTTNVSIPQGNYNISQFIAKMQSLLPNFTISYDSITSKLTFTNTLNQNFTFNSQTSTIMRLLGFPPKQDGNSVNSVLICPEPVNLVFTSNISIYSNIRSKSFNTNSANRQFLLCTIPIETQPFSMIVYKNYYGTYKVNTYQNMLESIQIRICDDNGNELDINNADYTITLQFDVINYVE